MQSLHICWRSSLSLISGTRSAQEKHFLNRIDKKVGSFQRVPARSGHQCMSGLLGTRVKYERLNNIVLKDFCIKDDILL